MRNARVSLQLLPRSIPAGKAYNFWSFGNIFIWTGPVRVTERPWERPWESETRHPSVASVSRCQPVTFKCPHATETNVAPSRAATGPPPASSHCLPPWHRWMVVPAAPVRAPRGAGRGTAYALSLSGARWPLPAHTQTILVVRISRPLDALDFVNRIIQKNYNCPQTIHRRQSTVSNSSLSSRACKTNGSTCTGAVKLELRGRR
jgi:hypothetical protein